MQNENLTCPICGEPTRVWYGNARKDGLCGKHADMLKAGEIFLDSHGRWRETATKNILSRIEEKAPDTVKSVKAENEATVPASELTCIICGEPSNGKHFCLSCYTKYKDKVVYIQVKKCAEFSKLDAEYGSDLTCDDGHMVKSPYEKIIDNWLYSEGIKHAYEAKLDIDETHDLTPDFYIPEYNGIKNIYIEFWGYGDSNTKYQRIKEYKMSVYPELVKRDNIAVVYLCKAEVDNDSYKKKIKYAIQGQIKE